MDVTAATKFFRIRKSSFVLMLTATLGVIFFGVLEGILIAVALSILMFFRRSWWPKGAILGRGDSLDSWHSIRRYPEGTQVPAPPFWGGYRLEPTSFEFWHGRGNAG
jgi:MFS superfamily sulfate permease-like transporter